MHGRVFENVERFQFFQDTPGKAELRLLPSREFGDGDLAAMRAAFEEKISGVLDLEIRVVDVLPLTKRGKGIYLIQELPVATMQKTGMTTG